VAAETRRASLLLKSDNVAAPLESRNVRLKGRHPAGVAVGADIAETVCEATTLSKEKNNSNVLLKPFLLATK
jgi:hypothetical protein